MLGNIRSWTLATLPAIALLATACAEGSEPDASTGGGSEDCSVFQGETVTLVVPYSPGGGYDSFARMIAPYLEEELGASVVVENHDGAGGLLAINNLLAAEPDGTELAIMNAVGAGAGALAEAEGVQFDLDQLTYVGRVAVQEPVFVVGADSGYESLEDVQAVDGFRFASTGPGAADFINANFLIRLLDLDGEVVTGFDGSEESELAVIRGDVDGQTGDLDSRLIAIESGDQVPLLTIDAERGDELPDVPTLLELELSPEDQKLAEALVDLSIFGRPIVAPPDVPQDRLTCIRHALDRTVNDEELVAEAESSGRPVDWMSGEELDELVERLLKSPEEFKQALRDSFSS